MHVIARLAVLVCLCAWSCGGGPSTGKAPELREFSVFLSLDVTAEEREKVRDRLEAHDDSAEVDYVDRDEAFAEFQELLKDDEDSLNSVDAEDLPESFRVTVKDGGDMEAIASDVEDMPGVDEIVFPNETAPPQ